MNPDPAHRGRLILRSLRKIGWGFWLDGNIIRYNEPEGADHDAARDLIQTDRPSVVLALKEEEATDERKKSPARRFIAPRLRFAVLRKNDFTCVYCGRRPPEVALEVDHVFPVSKGGTNDESNLVACCSDCNLGKGDTPIVPTDEAQS